MHVLRNGFGKQFIKRIQKKKIECQSNNGQWLYSISENDNSQCLLQPHRNGRSHSAILRRCLKCDDTYNGLIPVFLCSHDYNLTQRMDLQCSLVMNLLKQDNKNFYDFYLFGLYSGCMFSVPTWIYQTFEESICRLYLNHSLTANLQFVLCLELNDAQYGLH